MLKGDYTEPGKDEIFVKDGRAFLNLYKKHTCLWVSDEFIMPEHKIMRIPTEPSKQHMMLGGKSIRTKNIRSCTPRGFAQAVFEANHDKT